MKNARPYPAYHPAHHQPVNGPRGRTTRPRLPIGRDVLETHSKVDAAVGRALRVLLVEDDVSVSESTRRLLQSEGFHVDCAFDGESALARALTRSHDVILLDRMLPDSSGDQVVERLRLNGNSTPVVILTGFPDYESALNAGRLNVSGYLVKSTITGADLAASIRKATAQVVVPLPTTTGPKMQLFSAYGGKTSRSFSALGEYVRSDELNSPDLARQLALAISARDLTFIEFLAAGKSLCLVNRKTHLPLERLLPTIREWVDSTSLARPLDSRFEDILSRLEMAGPNWSEISEESSAAALHVHRITLWRCVGQIGLTFAACRQAIVIRRTVLQLAETREHIRQIAFQLGYRDPSRLDKDFDAFFNFAPTQFRRLCD